MATETSTRVRWAGAAAAALACALILAGTFLPWWSGGGDGLRMGIGLREVDLCSGDTCRSTGLEDLGQSTRAWLLCGATGFGLGWVAALFLAGAAVVAAAAARRPDAGGAWPGRVARAAAGLSLFALVVGVGFAGTYPGFSGLSLAAGVFLYLGGAALGVGSAGVLLARAPA